MKTKINKTIQLDTIDEDFAYGVEELCGKPERFITKLSIFGSDLYELYSWETNLTEDLSELLREDLNIYSFYVDLYTKPTKEMLERYKNITIGLEYWQFLDRQFEFGKFKSKTGREVLRLEPSYIKWCINNVAWFRISKYDLYYINKELPYFKLSPKEYKILTIKALLSKKELILKNQKYDPDDDLGYRNLENNKYYNDALDYDQQSPEFWENF